VGHYVIIGGCVFSPVLYAWYKWLDKAFPGNSGKVVMKKVCKYPDPVGSRDFPSDSVRILNRQGIGHIAQIYSAFAIVQ
jgi:hypothetical protein